MNMAILDRRRELTGWYFVVAMNSPEQDDGMILDFDIWQATNLLIRETVERRRAT